MLLYHAYVQSLINSAIFFAIGVVFIYKATSYDYGYSKARSTSRLDANYTCQDVGSLQERLLKNLGKKCQLLIDEEKIRKGTVSFKVENFRQPENWFFNDQIIVICYQFSDVVTERVNEVAEFKPVFKSNLSPDVIQQKFEKYAQFILTQDPLERLLSVLLNHPDYVTPLVRNDLQELPIDLRPQFWSSQACELSSVNLTFVSDFSNLYCDLNFIIQLLTGNTIPVERLKVVPTSIDIAQAMEKIDLSIQQIEMILKIHYQIDYDLLGFNNLTTLLRK